MATYWKILAIVEFVESPIPAVTQWTSHRPEDTPSVDIVVRHFDKS